MAMWLQIAAAIFSMIGVVLLAREVLIAQEAEQHMFQLGELERIDALYAQGRIREFYIEYYMYQGRPRAEAEEFARHLDDQHMRDAAEAVGYDNLRKAMQASLDRFRARTIPAVYALRKRLVRIGVASLVLSAILAICAAAY